MNKGKNMKFKGTITFKPEYVDKIKQLMAGSLEWSQIIDHRFTEEGLDLKGVWEGNTLTLCEPIGDHKPIHNLLDHAMYELEKSVGLVFLEGDFKLLVSMLPLICESYAIDRAYLNRRRMDYALLGYTYDTKKKSVSERTPPILKGSLLITHNKAYPKFCVKNFARGFLWDLSSMGNFTISIVFKDSEEESDILFYYTEQARDKDYENLLDQVSKAEMF